MKRIRKYSVDIVVVIFFTLIAAGVAISQRNIEIFFVIVFLPLSVLSAKYFGDVAGGKAAREYAEKEARRTRIIAIKSLLNEVQRVRDLAQKNAELVEGDRVHNTRAAVRMPITAFETAFVSKESFLLDDSMGTPDHNELSEAVGAYLTEAYSINALIEVRLAAIVSHGTGGEQRTGPTREIQDRSENLSKIVDRLESCLKRELVKALQEYKAA